MTIHPIRRVLVAGGFVIATVAASALFTPGNPASTAVLGETNCPPGMTENPISGSCFEGGNGQAPGPAQAPPNQIGEIDGIPCTGRNTGECIGLSENQAPGVQPHSSVSSSP